MTAKQGVHDDEVPTQTSCTNFWRGKRLKIYDTFASSLIFDPHNMGNLMIPAETLPTNQQKESKLGGWEIRLFEKYPQVQVGII